MTKYFNNKILLIITFSLILLIALTSCNSIETNSNESVSIEETQGSNKENEISKNTEQKTEPENEGESQTEDTTIEPENEGESQTEDTIIESENEGESQTEDTIIEPENEGESQTEDTIIEPKNEGESQTEGTIIEPETEDQDKEDTTMTDTVNQEPKLGIQVGDTLITAVFAENSSAKALIKELEKGEITINMHDYGNFEKVGPLGVTLPRNDEQISTVAGDIILYQGNNFVIYYDTNSWSFTRLAKIENLSQEELKDILGDGNVSITLKLTF